jgi:probable rRNA maturation factor
MKIRMTNQQQRKKIPLKAIESRLTRLRGGASGGGEVEITFIDDATIAEVAGRYRGSHKPTDVLSFGYDSADGGLTGEILISAETAYHQANERGVKFIDELTLLCLHGLLHLSGIDDETKAGWCEMRRAEFEGMMTLL